MAGFSRTPTPVSSRISISQNQFQYSPTNPINEWSVSDNSELWEHSSRHLRTPESHCSSPYSDSRTSLQQSPNLQSPSVDSFQSPSKSFLRPFPPDKLDQENSVLSRNHSKVKRDLMGEIKKESARKPDFKSTSDKVSVGINTAMDMFTDRPEEKNTTDETVGVTSLPSQNYERLRSNFWPGLSEIIKPLETGSSPSNPSSPYLPPFAYGSSSSLDSAFIHKSTSDSIYASQTTRNQNSPNNDSRQQFLKNEPSCYQKTSSATPCGSYQVRINSHLYYDKLGFQHLGLFLILFHFCKTKIRFAHLNSTLT